MMIAILVKMPVWESIKALGNDVDATGHVELLRQRGR